MDEGVVVVVLYNNGKNNFLVYGGQFLEVQRVQQVQREKCDGQRPVGRFLGGYWARIYRAGT